MMLDQTQAFLTALSAGRPDEIYDFRAIHDKNRGLAAIPMRGTLEQCAANLEQLNSQGYGIFVAVNKMDGVGREAHNISAIRAQFVDLDSGDVGANYQKALAWGLKPNFTVISSPGRAHVYWISEPHADLTRFVTIQKKLITLFEGDPACIDGPRVMRLPGTYNHKRDQPSLVGYIPHINQQPISPDLFERWLATVPAGVSAVNTKPLGDVSMQAPSFEWAVYALNKIDPGALDREEWLKVTAAYKTASWSAGEQASRTVWDLWCAKYPDNNPAENEKLWRSIKETKAGWGLLTRSAGIVAELKFGGIPVEGNYGQGDPIATPEEVLKSQQLYRPDALAGDRYEPSSWLVSPGEQEQYFKGCTLIESMGRMLVPSGRLFDTTKFNASFGGFEFVISMDGKTTDEPWKAATRGRIFNVVRADHLRFLPAHEPGEIILDEFRRRGVNTYKPAIINMREGDPARFIGHLRTILPDERDVKILLSFLAHCVQKPGVKVPWAPLIQSVPGAGKGVVKLCMTHALGSVYIHSPNAKELTDGGGKFNAWMRSKLLIICDEIRVGEKRDMLEVLKPMISEERIEIQGKGADQEQEDNPANWIFFTNYKDAIPIDRNERRYSIIYSTMQSVDDLIRAGLDGHYFSSLYDWIKFEGGKEIVAHFLNNYTIEPEFDPSGTAQRAPMTSSWAEALVQSRGRVEQIIAEAVDSGESGFRNGWISSVKVNRLMKDEHIRIGTHALKRAYINLGYSPIGRAQRAFLQEETKQPHLWSKNPNANIEDYPKDQGYEV